jgi:hypothetical protein
VNNMAPIVEDAEALSLREALHEAHFTKQAAEQKLANCQKALARGEAVVRDAQAEINRLEGLAHEIATAEAERLAHLAAGRPVAASPNDDAEDRARVRQVADQRLADAGRAAGLLQREVEAAKANLATATRKIDAAIGALLLATAERLASELLVAETIARDLRLQLNGLAGQWLPQGDTLGQPARIRLGARAAGVLGDLPVNDDRHPRRGPAHIDPVAPVAQEWQRTIAALRADPEAKMPGMES